MELAGRTAVSILTPVIGKLELIAYNAYGPYPIAPIKKNSIPFYTALRQSLSKTGIQGWFNLLFADAEFVEHYFAALDRFTSPGYLESFFNDISSDRKKKESYIFKDEPSRGILFPVYFHNREMIRSYLYPKLPLKVYLKQSDDQAIRLSVANPRFLPVVIDGIVLKPSGQFLAVPSPLKLEGKHIGQPLDFREIEIPTPDIGKPILRRVRTGDTLILDDIQVKYHSPGIRKPNLAPIDAYPLFFSSRLISTDENQSRLAELTKNGILDIDDEHKAMTIKSGKWLIEKNIVIPKGYKTRVAPGSELILNKGGCNYFIWTD